MREGYWKFYRSMWDWPWSNRPAYFVVWCWLLSEAQYQDGKSVIFHGQRIQLKSGQLTCGRKQISKATGVPEGTVYRILQLLQDERQIEQRSDRQKSIITIVKWTDYQDSEQRMNNDRTTNEQRMNTTEERKKERIINIDKKKNKEKSYTPVDKFEPTTREGVIAKEIAQELGEEYINFILSAIKKKGIDAVQRAYGYVREHQSPQDKRKLFNSYIESIK